MDNFNERGGRNGDDSQYQYEESVTDSQVEDSVSTGNPFSESSCYRDIDYASGIYSESIHDGGYGSEHGIRERDEDSISRFPKMDNFNELGRNGIDSQYEEIVTDSHVAPEFDEYGGYAPPSIYGYDDATYVDADGRSEYQEGLRVPKIQSRIFTQLVTSVNNIIPTLTKKKNSSRTTQIFVMRTRIYLTFKNRKCLRRITSIILTRLSLKYVLSLLGKY